LHVASIHDLAPYFVEEVREYLEHTYGTAAVHDKACALHHARHRMQKAADAAVRDGCIRMTGVTAGAEI